MSDDPLLLGGSLSPIGIDVGFVEAPLNQIIPELKAWRDTAGQEYKPNPFAYTFEHLDTTTSETFRKLEPLKTPWNKELLVALRNGWTMYLNNDRGGGDAFPFSYIAKRLDCHYIIAIHQPRDSEGNASTQFQLFGPEGEPPLQYVRTVAAHCEDGRWSWYESGAVQDFEQPDAYRQRKIVDRLTRPMVIDYLAHFGLHPDALSSFGEAVVVTYANL